MLLNLNLNLQFKPTQKKISDVEKSMSQSRLEKLQQQKAQIEAKIKGLQSREQQQARKNDTRRKIIAGALALHHMEKNKDDPFSKKLFRLLNEYVTKPYERNLFGLPALPENPQQTAANDPGDQNLDLRQDFQAER
jgi:hypothetical protein